MSTFEEEALKEYAVWFEDPNRVNALPKPVHGHEWFMVKVASEVPSAVSHKPFVVADAVNGYFPAIMVPGKNDLYLFPPRDGPSWDCDRNVRSLWKEVWVDADRTKPGVDLIRLRLQPRLGTEMTRYGQQGWLFVASL